MLHASNEAKLNPDRMRDLRGLQLRQGELWVSESVIFVFKGVE